MNFPAWARSVAIVSAVLVVGTILFRLRDDRIRAEARVEAVRDSLERVIVAEKHRSDSLDAAIVLTRAELQRERTRADSQRVIYIVRERQAVQEVARAGATLDSTLNNLREVSPPPLVPTVVLAQEQLQTERAAHLSLAESLRGQISSLTISLSTSDSTVVLQDQQLASRDLFIATLEEALAVERRVATPSLFARTRKAGTIFLIGAGVGWFLRGSG